MRNRNAEGGDVKGDRRSHGQGAVDASPRIGAPKIVTPCHASMCFHSMGAGEDRRRGRARREWWTLGTPRLGLSPGSGEASQKHSAPKDRSRHVPGRDYSWTRGSRTCGRRRLADILPEMGMSGKEVRHVHEHGWKSRGGSAVSCSPLMRSPLMRPSIPSRRGRWTFGAERRLARRRTS